MHIGLVRAGVKTGLLLLPTAIAVTLATAAAAQQRAAGFKVRSTIDGMTALPHRVRWTVSSTLPQSQVKSGGVSFLIDGKIVNFGQKLPLTFGDNGYLVTSWLAPGTHSFTARVWSKDGVAVDDTVVARVAATPVPPASLAGSWKRTVDMTSAPKVSPGDPAGTLWPAGAYRIVFDRRWIEDHFPGKFVPKASDRTGAGLIQQSDWTPAAKSFHVQGSVTWKVGQESDPNGGSWCNSDGPGADYTWSVRGNTLTLTPVGGQDPCSIRGYVWTGIWTRVR